MTPWHARSAEEALSLLGSSETGLSRPEVESRRQRFGENRLPVEEPPGVVRVVLHQFKDPLVYLLLAAAAVSVAIGEARDAVFIFAVLVVNASIGAVQERKAETSAQALRTTLRVTAITLRDGQRQRVDAAELVPGDVIELEAGSAVPADVRLMSSRGLTVDESLLTGESMPVDKRAGDLLAEDAPLHARANLAFAGTSVVTGRARGVVCRTASAAEVGRIATSLVAAEAGATPLQVRLRRLTRGIAVLVLGGALALGGLQLALGATIVDVFFLGVALAVSAIPEGLPVAITVALAIASSRMARRHVIVRNLPAVEGLGACTLVATDKTGTLTENKLTVQRLRLPSGEDLEVSGVGYQVAGEVTRDERALDERILAKTRALVEAGVLCNEAELAVRDGEVERRGDAVDVALLVLGAKLELWRAALLEAQPEIGAIPFAAERRYAATFHETGGAARAYVKGAVEAVASMCDLDDRASVLEQHDALAHQGYRVIAVASGDVGAELAKDARPEALRGLTLLGLVGIIDPIRPEVPGAVAQCKGAGVEVRMVTGDHPATGLAVGRELGIASDEGEVTTGAELERLREAPDALDERVRKTRVFARVEPAQKKTILQSYQRVGHFVAVTGDGVNDAPALHAANIGVAMGKEGTEAARSAADLVLTDDNFASIVNGIEEGRVAYNNVRKVVWLLISTGVAELVLFFLALLTGLPLPLGPVQLLWLNLVTNGVQDVALAFEKGEPDVLNRPPRSPDQPILNRLLVEETAVAGGWIGLVAFGVFFWLIRVQGLSEVDARNLLLLLMVLFENAHILNCRSESRLALSIPPRNNWLLMAAIVAAQGLHIASMYLPGLREVLEVQPISAYHWLALLPVAASLILVVDVYKLLRGRRLASALRPSAARPRRGRTAPRGRGRRPGDRRRSR